MQRSAPKRIPVGSSSDGKKQSRLVVQIRGDECLASGTESRTARARHLREFVDNPALEACGPVPYDAMRVFWNGAWIIELSAVVTEDAA